MKNDVVKKKSRTLSCAEETNLLTYNVRPFGVTIGYNAYWPVARYLTYILL